MRRECPRRALRALALAALAGPVAACGGSHAPAAARPAARPSRQAVAPNAGQLIPRPAGGPSPGGGSASRAALPLSRSGPSTCTVYEPGYATQIVIDSRSLDVRAECQVWTSSHHGDGYLWGYERGASTPLGQRLCFLTDPQRVVTASVIEETGFVPLSAAERSRGALACAIIRASGWTEALRPSHRHRRRRQP